MSGQATVTSMSATAAPPATAVAAVLAQQPLASAAASHMAAVVTALEQGPKGLSAYDLAVKAGYLGTEMQWIASLAGGSLTQRLASLAPQTAVVPIGPTLPFAGDAPGLPLAEVALQPGFPLALDRATDQATYARADTHDLCFVFGLAQAVIPAGGAVLATRLFISLADWTAVAGTETLAVGRPYFLAPAGGITLTPPGKPDSVCNVRVGEALTPQTLVFGTSAPILL